MNIYSFQSLYNLINNKKILLLIKNLIKILNINNIN
jgi:hypothetical protein